MDKSFDFGALLKKNEKKHKIKPQQFESVAGGVKKRLETNLKLRKSCRLTTFDSVRNLSHSSECHTPAAISEAQRKVEYRRQQLVKWKEEKEKKKKEAATKKIKPFLTGIPHSSAKYVLPPPPKVVPSMSGRVTRSQAAKNKKDTKEPRQVLPQSFAPKDANFHAPQIKNLTKMPKLAPVKMKKDKKSATITFEPVLHPMAKPEPVKQLRSRTYIKQVPSDTSRTRITRSAAVDIRAKGKITKPIPKAIPKYLQSSSSSETEPHSQTQSTSSSDIDLTAKLLSSSSDNEVTKSHSSSAEISSTTSLKSSSSSELEPEKQSSILMTKSRKLLSAESSQSKPKTPRRSKTPRKSQQPSTKNDLMEYTPKVPIPKSESSSEEKLRSPKSQQQITPQQIVHHATNISPYVTVSRGKDNARKEMLKKLEEGLLDEDASDMENVDHFRRQLASEIKRLTEMCDTWDKIYEQVALPEPVQELVLVSVGQARLLMSQKLQQFGRLVERCARPALDPTAPLVTPADLHGFWDMVFMQVVNVDLRFKELEELKARNWVDEAPAQSSRKVTRPAARPGTGPAARPGTGPAARPGARSVGRPRSAASRLKDVIAAARKAKAEKPSTTSEERTFEAGFFSVRSPARPSRSLPPSPTCSPTCSPRTPANKPSLLKAVLSSEANKASASKQSASFAMLRASLLGRNIECEGVAPLPATPLAPVNIQATPGRSILKAAHDMKTPNKCIKIVLFDEINTPPKNNKEQTDAAMDNNLSGIEQDSTQDKENSRRKAKLTRQDAVVGPTTRSQSRKSMETPRTGEKSSRRTGRKKVLEEVENKVVEEKTPKPFTRSRRSAL